MRAVSFNVTIPRYVLGKALGPVTDAAYFGGPSGVRYGEVAEPGLPGRDWVRLGAVELGLDCLRRQLQGLPVHERIDFEKV